MTLSIPIIPDHAPFSSAQRAWLNGFFAGLLSQGNGSDSSQTASAPAVPAMAARATVIETEEEFAWHDPALPLEERMTLAKDKPHERKLMAAMAQLDCGACGYLCKTYSEAIASGQERDLSRCAPGGKETSRKLKELVALHRAEGGSVAVAAPMKSVKPEKLSKFGRHHPFPAPLLECQSLNKTGSMKDTRLVCFDLKGSGLTYSVGDALGVFPENDPDLVGWVIESLDASGSEKVITPDGGRVSLFEALSQHYSLGKPGDALLETLVNCAADPADASALKAMLSGDGCVDGDEVLDLLRQFPSARPEPGDLVAALNPMQPRLYSISSSLLAHPEQVHLTVGVVRFLNNRGRQCKGVASTFFAERMKAGQKARVFVQPSHSFSLPESGDVPIIMVGPGTGIAPFRAFLQERKATAAMGRNWLLFGDQQREFDFLYEQELNDYRRSGPLTRLDTAFSRDQREKIYVQQRMLENGAEMWNWIKAGAHFYVCGDAKRMATDVDCALKTIAATHGGLSAESAKAFVADLTRSRRYQRDVY